MRTLAWIGFLVAAMTVGAASPAAPRPPNIVFILADDLGYGDLGCYGADRVKTPNCDRLAREGVRLTDAHSTASVCTPTRYAFMTGRYAWRQPGTGIAPGNATLLIKPGTPTAPSVLKRAGYRTALVGKWHLGLGETEPDFNQDLKPGPLELGFDEAFFIPATGDRVPCVLVENHRVVGLDPADPIAISYRGRIGNDLVGNDPALKLKMKGGPGHTNTVVNGIPRIGYMTGGQAARWVDEDIADTLAARAVRFIESRRDSPFFLFLATHDIHEPMVPHPRFKGTSDCGSRGDVIHQLDATVGVVLAALDRLKLASNTLVIVTSDNGGAIKNTYDDGTNPLHERQPPNGSLRGAKGTLYEGGHRVPFVARWPGRVPAGTVSPQLLGLVDMMATFAAAAGAPLEPGEGPDSFNVLGALTDPASSKQARDHLVFQNNGAAPLALRQGPWVYLAKGGPRQAVPGELYDLSRDPEQTNNAAALNPERVREMAARLATIREAGRSRF